MAWGRSCNRPVGYANGCGRASGGCGYSTSARRNASGERSSGSTGRVGTTPAGPVPKTIPNEALDPPDPPLASP